MNMTTNDYLDSILANQTLQDGSDELKALQERRAEVEKLLRDYFNESTPTIRYGGSKAKGTMIRESYDLDIICYFPHDETVAGETLEEIYNNVHKALSSKYLVEPKPSALRIKDANPKNRGFDFHIDVVPGRFTDETKSDTFLYQANGEKSRLKTNLEMHINHVKESGVADAVRLFKLWKVRNALSIKNFVLELAVIKLLKGKADAPLATQLELVWTVFRDQIDNLSVEDPANPTGNDLSELFSTSTKSQLGAVARRTLDTISKSGWGTVFGSVESRSNMERVEVLERAAAAVMTPSRPWCPEE